MEEKIEVPLYLGLKIQERLAQKFGIETDNKVFSRKELEMVDEMEIAPPKEGGLKGIELLSNIEKLTVESIGNTAFKTGMIPSISEDDIINIAKCRNLKELAIINQSKIKCLDCSRFQGLTSLTVHNNRALHTIEGLENVTTLESLSCYGNESLYEIKNLDQVILNNPDLYATELDILLFPDVIGFKRENGTYNLQADERLTWIQNTSKAVYVESMLKKEVNMNHSKMKEMHKKSLEILAQNHIGGDNLQMAEGIEKYMVQNVKYNNGFRENGELLENKAVVGARSTANGAYSAIINKQGNCEGFTRAMQYLLKLKGINSKNVYCVPKDENTVIKENYHSLIYLEENDLYSDPCYDAICFERGGAGYANT